MMEGKIKSSSVKQMAKIKLLEKQTLVRFVETITANVLDDDDEIIDTKKYHKDHEIVSDIAPHADFINAAKMLRKFVISICEFTGEYDKFDMYSIVGVSFSGMDDDETAAVIITAQKELESGKKITINTPLTLIGPESPFADADKLDKFLKKLTDEAYEYYNGKHAENPQLTLEFAGGDKEQIKVRE